MKTLSKSAARKWFARFRAGKHDVKDEPRSGRSITEKSDEIMVKVERDKHVSTVEFARHRPQNSFKSFTQSWIQKEARCLDSSRVEVRNMMDRINIYDTLLKQNEIEPFLKRMITGDEK